MHTEIVTGIVPGFERLYAEAKRLSDVLREDVMFAEIGTRAAHSSITILSGIKDSKKKGRWFHTVDPYGLKPYNPGSRVVTTFDYGENHYRPAMVSLSAFSLEHELNHCHWRMKSVDFMRHVEDIEFWHDGNVMRHVYGFVFLDGEHDVESVEREARWFIERLVPGGMIVSDDIDRLDEMEHERLRKTMPGWERDKDRLYWTKPS